MYAHVTRGFLDSSSLIHFDCYQMLSVSVSISVSISLYHPPLLRIQLGIAFQHHLSPSIPDIDLALISLTTLHRSTVDCLASKIHSNISNKIGHVLPCCSLCCFYARVSHGRSQAAGVKAGCETLRTWKAKTVPCRCLPNQGLKW